MQRGKRQRKGRRSGKTQRRRKERKIKETRIREPLLQAKNQLIKTGNLQYPHKKLFCHHHHHRESPAKIIPSLEIIQGVKSWTASNRILMKRSPRENLQIYNWLVILLPSCLINIGVRFSSSCNLHTESMS